jgi:hypothetical protein
MAILVKDFKIVIMGNEEKLALGHTLAEVDNGMPNSILTDCSNCAAGRGSFRRRVFQIHQGGQSQGRNPHFR